MRKTRQKQTGHIYKQGSAWYLRYREDVLDENGSVQRVQRCRKLTDAVGQNRSRDAARALAQEFLKPLNDGTQTAESSMSLARFIEHVYMPYVTTQKQPSTTHGYNDLWTRYIKPRADAQLRDIRTLEVELMLREIAADFDLSKTTLLHIKHFFGGVFTYARRVGVLNGPNPVRDAEVPSARPGGETHACTLEEIIAYLQVVPEPGATLIATAAFTGVRKAELRALRWENYNGQEIKITQKAWGRHIGPPKRDSRGDVPVIPLLAQYLNRQRMAAGDPISGYMFANTLGTPMSLDRLTSYLIRPALRKAGLQWHGWHAFRRGLATNLHRLGVQDKIIQRILRHANLATTMNIYVKSVSEDAVAAMLRLQARCSRLLPTKPLSERIM